VIVSTRGVRILLLAAMLAVAACGSASESGAPVASIGATDAPPPSATAPPTTEASGQPTAEATAEASPAGLTQSDTAWGRIWDGVPTGFPRAAGARDADDATAEPVSDAYVVEGGDAADIVATLQAAMEGATYSTESLSGPLEDGSFVLESTGPTDCRVQTAIVPQGGLILVTVLYGAACPAS
jgi:hypothetical protein